jgi:RNA polymerase sigma factor (sigma-70 family)
MTRTLLQLVLRHAADGPGSDADLLGRFVGTRDEAAFSALVRRHGPMVWAVCRQSVPNRTDAEDAFQAVFLAFSRSAGSVRRPDHLAGWLHGAAVRIAAKAKRSFLRRKAHEGRTARSEVDVPVAVGAWDEMLAAVHAEVSNLPPSLRAAFVLCDLEGVDPTEAAARLGLKANTLSGQLTRARQRLLAALSKRGIGAGLAAVGTAAAVPQALANQAVVIIGVTPAASIIELATEVTAMSVNKLKLLTAGLLVAGGLAAGGVGLWSKAEAQAPPPGGLPPGAGGQPRRDSGYEPPGGSTPPRRDSGLGLPAAPVAAFEYLFVAKPGTLSDVANLLRGKALQNWEYTGPLDVDPADPKGLRGVEGVTKDTRVVLVFKRAPAPMPGMGMMGGGGMWPGGMGMPAGREPGYSGWGGPGPSGWPRGSETVPGGTGYGSGAGGTGSPDGGGRATWKETKVFRLKHKLAEELAAVVLSTYTDARGKKTSHDPVITADAKGNSLVVTGATDDVKIVEQIIAVLDTPPTDQYEVIPLKNAKAEEVAKVLNEVFNGPDGKGGRVAVVAEKKSNAVVVTKASAADLKTIKDLLKNAMDVKAGGR